MIKKIFYCTLLFSTLTNAQSLNQQNEPAIGETITMYECNSAYSNFSSTNGTGVIWDFSNLGSASGNPSKIISVLAPDVTTFSPATKMTKIPGFISNYWLSTSTERTSNGFIFTDKSFGDIVVKFKSDPDNEKVLKYPFLMSDSYIDTYSGTCTNSTLAPSGSDCTGTITSSIDGLGTLILAGPTSFTNVMRHKTVEVTNTSFVYFTQNIPAVITRTQYDYYNTSGAYKLPIFSHITISIAASGMNNNVALILSSVNPVGASLHSNEDVSFSIFPNPSHEILYLKGNFSKEAEAKITDYLGRELLHNNLSSFENKIDISALNRGAYIVVISDKGVQYSKKIILE